MSKIIDFEKKGNVVRLYCGKDRLKEWWGDDWDHRPYEHNACPVYSKHVECVYDIFIDFDREVLEPCNDWHYHGGSPWSKEDMIAKKVPCIVIAKTDECGTVEAFTSYVTDDNAKKIYFGDDPEDIVRKYKEILHVNYSAFV